MSLFVYRCRTNAGKRKKKASPANKSEKNRKGESTTISVKIGNDSFMDEMYDTLSKKNYSHPTGCECASFFRTQTELLIRIESILQDTRTWMH